MTTSKELGDYSFEGCVVTSESVMLLFAIGNGKRELLDGVKLVVVVKMNSCHPASF